MHVLRNFWGYPDSVTLNPVVPADIPLLDIDYDEVLEIVHRNNPFTDNIKRRLIEAEKQIALARSDRGFLLDVYASIGFTGTNKQLSKTYDNWQNRQIVTLGVRVPILDCGIGRGRVEVARSKQNLEKGNIEQDTRDFEQDIKMLVMRLQSQPYLMDMYTVAQNRYKKWHMKRL